MDDFEWPELKMLVERGMPVRPMSSGCTCGDKHFGNLRSIVKPGGWVVECLACRRKWVEWELTDVRRR